MSGQAIIHGTGLMGASVGLALRGVGWDVAGWDPDAGALHAARDRGAISRALGSPEEDVVSADLVVLAGPPGSIVASLAGMRSRGLVTDIAGVKTPVVAAAGGVEHFVGGHPMVGGATRGAALASSAMFHGATWVLTTDEASQPDLERMQRIVSSLGANPVLMTAAEHDRVVARVSHVPHLLAAALIDMAAGEPSTLSLAGGGFRDLTRVAGGEPGWWTEVLTANSREVSEALATLERELAGWRDRLETAEVDGIRHRLEQARGRRESLGEHHAQVRVILLDRPGEIARVGHALERTRTDVRDLQLRHGEHGGGGVLTISVASAAEAPLRAALEEEGFSLEDV
jgi:prephenate dehydrogenase